MNNIWVHIGLHKTATTFLQQEVFPKIPGVFFVPPGGSLSGMLRCPRGTNMLVSDESLSGKPWSRPPDPRYSWRADRELRLTNLAALVPRARIIVCFRRHRGWILSLYKQFLAQGGRLTLQEFFDLDRPSLISKEDVMLADLVDLLVELFGERLFLFTMREMGEFDNLLRELYGFIGAGESDIRFCPRQVNAGVRATQARLLRMLNSVTFSDMNPKGILPLRGPVFRRLRLDPRNLCQRRLAWVPSQDVDFSDGTGERLDAFFAEDWGRVLDGAASRGLRLAL